MHRIVAGIKSLEQHNEAIRLTPEVYRPPSCPHCGITIVWCHGHYERKADLCNRGEANLNPVAIPRYCCSSCRRTFSRLPECIAPWRWYNWLLQQIGLRAVFDGTPLVMPPACSTPARRTLERWRNGLQERGQVFRSFLTSRFSELGRLADDTDFWRQVFDTLGLSEVMAWLDKEINVP